MISKAKQHNKIICNIPSSHKNTKLTIKAKTRYSHIAIPLLLLTDQKYNYPLCDAVNAIVPDVVFRAFHQHCMQR